MTETGGRWRLRRSGGSQPRPECWGDAGYWNGPAQAVANKGLNV